MRDHLWAAHAESVSGHKAVFSHLLRGGRVTKWKGRAASFAPNVAQLLTSVSRAGLLPAAVLAGLAASPAAAQTDYYWDANGAQGGSGGTGDWNTSSALWSESNSDVLGPYRAWVNNAANPNNAIFGVSAAGVPNSAGTITLTEPITVHNLTFQSVHNWALDGGTLTLAGTTPTLLTHGHTTINSIIAGTAGLTKTGNANLRLNGANTFSGGITVSGGTLIADNDAALGAPGNNITTTAGSVVGFQLLNGTTNRTITVDGDRLTLGGAGAGSALITGSGAVHVGVGVAMSNDLSTYTGATAFFACNGRCETSFSSIANLNVASALGAPTTVENGTITWSQASQYWDALVYTGDGDSSNRNWVINSGGVASTFWGAYLRNEGSGTLTLTGDMALNGAAGTIFVAETADIELLGTLSGSSPVYLQAVASQQTITIGGANTYTGDTTIGDDTLVGGVGLIKVAAPILEDAGVASSLGAGSAINLTNGGTLSYTGGVGGSNRTFTVDGSVGLLNEGTGILTLSGPLSFTTGGAADTLTFGGNFAGTSEFSGGMSGAGDLASTGSTTWLLTGANTRTGTVTVDSGTLQAGNASAFGTTTGVTVNGGVLDLNGFDLTTPQLSGTGGSVALNGGADLIVNGLTTANNSSYAGSLTGDGGLIKRGASTLTLAGQSNYTGATSIQGGTLALNFAAASAPTDNIIGATSPLTMAGGALTITGADGETNNQTFGGLNVTAGTNRITVASGAGGAMNVNLGALSNSGGLMDFTLPANGSVTTTNPLNGQLGWATVNGRDYAEVSGGVIGAFTAYTDKDEAATWAGGEVISDDDGDVDSFSGTVTGSVQLGGLQYTTAQNSIVGIGGGNTLGVNGTIIVADTVGATTKEITGGSLTGPAAGGTLGIIHNGTGNFLVSSQIVDSGGAVGFTKAGPGLVTFNNDANSYTGATTLSGGTLSVTSIGTGGAASAIGQSSAASSNLVLESGRLSYNGVTATTDRGFTLVNGGPTREIEVVGTTNLTFTGLVTSPGDASLTKIGAGTLTLANAANDYAGVTRILGGTLSVGALADGGVVSGIGRSSSDPASLVLRDGGRLQYTGGSVTIDRGATLEAGNGRIDVSTGATTLTMGGVVVGVGTLAKDGTGTLELCGTNTYTGGTNVAAGTLRACSPQAFGPLTGVTGSMTVAAGATLDLNGFDNTVSGLNGAGVVELDAATLSIRNNGSFSGTITGLGGVSVIAGAQTLNGCTSNYTGATTISAGHLYTDCIRNGGEASGIGASTNASGNLVIRDSGLMAYTAIGVSQTTDRGVSLANGWGYIQVNDAATTLTFSGIFEGAGGLIKRGAGALVLSGANTYSGETRVEGGRLVAGSSDAFDQGAARLFLSDAAGAVFDLNGFNAAFTSISGGGASGGDIDLGAGTLTITHGQAQTYAGKIGGAGNLVKETSAAVQTLTSCASDYDGTTTVRAGVLEVSCLADGGAASSIGDSSAANSNLVLDGGALRYIGAGGSTNRLFTLGPSTTSRLEASGTGAIDFTGLGPIAFSSPDANQTIILGGTSTASNELGALITNNGAGATSLTKENTGTWILTNPANTYTGVTSIIGGVLGVDTLANSGDPSSIGQSTNAASNLVIGSGGTLRYTGDGDITDRRFTLGVGTTAIESVGAGPVVFSDTGAVAYTGSGARVVSLGGTNADDNIMGATIGNQGGNVTSLAKNGSGVWVLTGDNTFTGSTVINDGNLVIGNGGTTGNAGAGNVIVDRATSTLSFNRSDTFNFTGTISGPGSIAQIGGGTTVLTSAGNSIAATSISAGALEVDGVLTTATIAMTGTSALKVDGTVQASGPSAAALTGDAGASTITVATGGALTANGDLGGGADVVTLTGTLNTGAGMLNLGDGDDTLTLNDGGVLGGAGVNAGAGAGDTLQVNNALDRTIEGLNVGGFEALNKQLAGILTLTGGHSYTAGATIGAGELRIGAGGASGSLIGNVLNNGLLSFNRSDPYGFGDCISGAGGVTQMGGGVTTLNCDNTYTGATNVLAGTLRINGDQSAATGLTTVASGARLGGDGVIGGGVTVAGGGILSPGNSPGTMTINGDLELVDTSILEFEFGQANVVGGPLNDLIIVNGNLVLDGDLSITETSGGTFGGGIYRIISYGGALTDNVLNETSPDYFVQTSIANQVNLVNSAGLALSFWDGESGPHSDSAINGGNGFWRAAGDDNWTDDAGLFAAPFANGSFAIFAGASGTVTVDDASGGVSASGMQFATGGYVVEGDDIALVGPQSTIRVGDGSSAGSAYVATIDSRLTGASQLVKTDLGTLVLGGANTYTGGTVIDDGVLQISSDANLGDAAGEVAIDGATLRNTAVVTSARGMTLGTNGGTLDAPADLTLTGVVGGAGALTKTGAGVLTLDGLNGYAGGTIINGGTVAVSADANLGDAAGSVTIDGATLRSTATFTSGRSVTLNSGGGVFDTELTGDLTLTSAVGGAGALTKTGAGRLTLTADNTYAGGTTISGGVLQVGDGGTTGSILGDAVNNGGLIFNRSNLYAFDGLISGGGTVAKQGAGVTVLTADNAYTGETNVEAGTLIVNGDQSAATGRTEVWAGATLGGMGVIGGDVEVQDDAALAPGDLGLAPGTLTINGGLQLGALSNLDYNFGQADVVGGAYNDLTIVHGDLTLDGAINVAETPGGDFGPGIYRVISYDGALTDLGLDETSPNHIVQTSIANQVNLVNLTATTLNFWDARMRISLRATALSRAATACGV